MIVELTVRDVAGRKIDTIRTEYDGTERDASRANGELREKAALDYGDFRNMNSTTIAYTEAGDRKFHVSPNGRFVTAADPCSHPPPRLYSWNAADGTLCVACC